MAWSTPVDIYCERTDPTFWAEPVNALSNLAFLIAALSALVEWRRADRSDFPVFILIVLVGVIGVGSFAFHTLATRGAALLDVIPITVFICGYLLLGLRRFLGMMPGRAAILTIGYLQLSLGISRAFPPEALNGSGSYLPALAALVVVGLLTGNDVHRRLLLAAAGVFAISLVFRTIDNVSCAMLPLGTHFVWHVLNAGVLYLLLRAAMPVSAAQSQKPQ